MTATATTARTTVYLRHVVHVAIAGDEHSLCGVRLIGAIDTEAPATCPACADHTFEQHPEIWSKVEGFGERGEVGGLPESTVGEPAEVVETIPAGELAPGDVVLDDEGNRLWAALDVEYDSNIDRHVAAWTSVRDQDDGHPRVYFLLPIAPVTVRRRA